MIGVLLKYYPVSDASASVPHGFIVLFIWLFTSLMFSGGPCGWWLPMEILPTNLGAKGSSVATAMTFLCNLCVSKTTPLLFVSIGYKTYFYYAGMSLALGCLLLLYVCSL
jgi:hypothetical protein